jgi:L-lactate dehydrogenase complex protein LldE
MDKSTDISLFVPCLIDQFYPDLASHTVAVLERCGFKVSIPIDQTCCGQPAFNAGYRNEATRLAEHFLRTFEKSSHIVAPSGSCISMVKNHYTKLSLAKPERDILERITRNMFEFSELLEGHVSTGTSWGSFPHRVYFHGSCHGLRELGIHDGPLRILRQIDGIDLIDCRPEQEECCGFGGVFSMHHASLSTMMGRKKIEYIESTAADYLVVNDAGCLIHLEGLLSRGTHTIKPIHLATLLFMALGLNT